MTLKDQTDEIVGDYKVRKSKFSHGRLRRNHEGWL